MFFTSGPVLLPNIIFFYEEMLRNISLTQILLQNLKIMNSSNTLYGFDPKGKFIDLHTNSPVKTFLVINEKISSKSKEINFEEIKIIPGAQTKNISVKANLPLKHILHKLHEVNIEIFSSQGVSHQLTLEFTYKNKDDASEYGANRTWQVSASSLTTKEFGFPAEYKLRFKHEIIFNEYGVPISDPDAILELEVLCEGHEFGDKGKIKLNFGTANKKDGLTTFMHSFHLSKLSIDGYNLGVIQEILIQDKKASLLYSKSKNLSLFYSNGREIRYIIHK